MRKVWQTSRIARIYRLRSIGRLPSRQRGFSSNYKWLVWTISALFVLFQFFLQLSSGEIVAGLMKSFHLSAFGGGILASAYYYIYVALQTPAGILMDRYGPRRLLSMGALVVMIGSGVFAIAPNVWVALLGRLLMGTGAAFAFVGSMNLVSRWFPAERFGFMVAMAETMGMLGILIGGSSLAVLVDQVGWRYCMYGAVGISALLAIGLWLIVRDSPANVTSIYHRPKGEMWPDLKKLMQRKSAWINGLYSGFMFSIVTVFVALWAVPYLQQAHHLSLLSSALVCNFLFVGVAIGGPTMGWIDSHFPARRYLLVGGAIAAAFVLSFIIYFPQLPIWGVSALMFVLGLLSSAYVLNFVIANEIATPQIRSTSIGFVNMFSVGMAPILQPLIGLFLFLLARHVVGANAHYSTVQYEVALTILPLCMLGAAIIGAFLPKRPVPLEQPDN